MCNILEIFSPEIKEAASRKRKRHHNQDGVFVHLNIESGSSALEDQRKKRVVEVAGGGTAFRAAPRCFGEA
ncbi:hypothetical protein ATANTOWER_000241 [Ataeniobius toweri]|uniref:Uncharacterized protein n=1 Tax=Ataeniobius toweri TaxID=208326 RepID=A0ABU7ACA0_9TELE|nr:hypothetical protein [Ataeniobius toweri]